MTTEENLESKILYRLVKTAYYLALIFCIFIVALFSWTAKPKKVINHTKSTFSCGGNTYSFDQAHIYMYSPEDNLDDYDYNQMDKLCFDYNKAYAEGYTKSDIDRYFLTKTEPLTTNRPVNIITEIEGNWFQVIFYFFVGTVLSYSILNILKEMLFYIFFGKKFSFAWFVEPLKKLK